MNKSISKFLYTFLLLLCIFVSHSQNNVEVAYINYTIVPKSNFKEGTGNAGLQNIEGNLVTPTLTLGKKTKLNTILYYRLSQCEYDSPTLESLNLPEQLHEVKLTFLTRHTFNSNWELLLVPRLNIRSDFEAVIGNKDIFPACSAIAMHTSNTETKFKWGFGLNYNNDFGKNSVIPILAFGFSNEKMRFNSYLPNNAIIVFLPNKKIEYGFGYSTDATLVHVNTNNAVEYIRTLNFHINPTFSYNVASNVWLNLKAGYVVRRNFDLYTSNFETPSSSFENKLKASMFVQMGVSLRSKQ
ncbi:DUF6268 family outer membrane beta-barrel protein [Flavobacterium sp.]|uniref:DUF6268 family outer membrane beta-barrel protein n=1 Tax=Flavobacterium sp. TaxID=239 RepID=UPI00286A70D1|nr:DUF6268 family outer membrane beta-barrel protein [Flavobacterium sp.]